MAQIARNLVAGATVGVIVIPSIMAFAIASGVAPEHGIYTSIIAGIIVAIFGATKVQVSGPTGAFVVILAKVVHTYGFSGLQLAIIIAGIVLLIMASLKLGKAVHYIPQTIINAFTSGIGAILLVLQWKYFVGIDKGDSLWQIDQLTSLIGLCSIAFLLLWEKYCKNIPGSMVLIVIITAIQLQYALPGVNTIGTMYGSFPNTFPPFVLPSIDLANIAKIFNYGLLIAFLVATESLLAAKVIDSLTGSKSDPNRELMAEGLANIGSALFSGLAATGGIGRAITNIGSGGNSRLAAIAHSAALLLILLVLAPYAVHIPLTCLAAILMLIAFNMINPKSMFKVAKDSFKGRQAKNDALVFVTTFVLTVTVHLGTAIAVGMLLHFLLRYASHNKKPD